MKRRGSLSLLALALTCLLVFAGTAAATVHSYFGTATMPGVGVSWTPAYNYYNWNRVYRPTVNLFALWYEGGAQYDSDSINNPFWHNFAGGYTRAYCANNEQYPVDTVTCQYDS
jgi:hypothetical protein